MENILKVFLGRFELNNNSKVASFDLDGTLIQPTDNKKFSDTDTDWEFYIKEIPDKIKKLHNDGYNIVIITNKKVLELAKWMLICGIVN